MLFDAKDMRIPLKFYIYSIKVFPVSRPPFWFPVELASNCASQWIVHRAILLSAAAILLSSKQTQQRWICFARWFTPFDSMVTKFITFSPKNHPPHLHFRWRNSITGWTISKISTSLNHALIALGIRRSAMENSDGQLILKNEWVNV